MGFFFVGLLITISSIVVTGFCSMWLWNWFMPLIAASVPKLTFSTAVGLAVVTSCFLGSSRSYKLKDYATKGDTEIFLDAVFTQIMNETVKPLSLLLIGWVIHLILF
jgi:hypothetical protein